MLDLESDDQRSNTDPRPLSETADSPDPFKSLGISREPIIGDELQTVERVLPDARQNYGALRLESAIKLDASVGSTPHYIQAIQSKAGALLRTNLPRTETSRTTETGIAWLLGRSRSCAIVFPDPAVSRCHAVVGFDAQQGFYVMDVGSSNGTFLNQCRLVTMQRYSLNNGDVVTISHIKIEIFLLSQD